MSNAASSQTVTRTCAKCGGAGKIRAFSHVAAGDCFSCGGRGVHVTTVARERSRKAAAKRRQAKAEATREAKVDAAMLAHHQAGGTLQSWHDQGCYCGSACYLTWNDAAMARQWQRVTGEQVL